MINAIINAQDVILQLQIVLNAHMVQEKKNGDVHVKMGFSK